MNQIAALDPQAAVIVQRLTNEREQRSMLIAAHSAGADARERSVLRDMAREAAEVGGKPYRARLAELALSDTNLTDPTSREAFFQAHATACETLELAAGWSTTSNYMSLLKQARNDPAVWPKVRDDPMALSFGARHRITNP